MRALAALAMAAASSMGISLAEQAQRGIDDSQGPPIGKGGPSGKKKFMSPEHYRECDPFYGIPSRGHTGAKSRMQQQLRGFEQTPVGKRNARGRATSNPFKSAARNKAFFAELATGLSHNQALKLARRVPA
jgi:hypothetical protein